MWACRALDSRRSAEAKQHEATFVPSPDRSPSALSQRHRSKGKRPLKIQSRTQSNRASPANQHCSHGQGQGRWPFEGKCYGRSLHLRPKACMSVHPPRPTAQWKATCFFRLRIRGYRTRILVFRVLRTFGCSSFKFYPRPSKLVSRFKGAAALLQRHFLYPVTVSELDCFSAGGL